MSIGDAPQLDVEIPELSQVAFVVEDIEDGMDRFGSILGIGPWQVHRFEPPALSDRTFCGESAEYSMVLALAQLGDTMIELIEPLEGPSLYTEHLEEHGEGLHHVACFAFDDPHAVVDAFEDAGMPVVQSGDYAGTEFWYFDTAAELNGAIFETAANVDAMPEPDRTYPE
ncbi:VOC family protein [Natrinema salifodinae]|uniref:Methylmalonyl-CoA epimerase n=1 Tax=Natrinema salifodinae TaxID=1202768 RepID=A0A1I0NEF2_9EURY|nr:VOC family protein [Natrinema salifodinae]SEV99786.1 methylmalonyl-CoA epimerase [Natrinema salifodinae]